MPRFAANLSMLFTEQDFLPASGRRQGRFQRRGIPVPVRLQRRRNQAPAGRQRLTQVLFNLPAGDWAKGERGIACHPDRVEEFRAGVDKAIAYAKVLGNTQVNCLAGIRPQGVDGHRAQDLRRQPALRRRQAQGGRHRLVMEAINTRDIPAST
jgi:hydroxypyruvate isomerase